MWSTLRFLIMMNSRWGSSGRNSPATPTWRSTFRMNSRKVRGRRGSISSTSSTRCSRTSWSRWWTTPTSKGCRPPARSGRRSPSRYPSSGKNNWRPCLISQVSPISYLSAHYIYSLGKPGKTLHLLKARSKPIQSGRKRKKVPTLGTYTQYKDSKSKASVKKSVDPA